MNVYDILQIVYFVFFSMIFLPIGIAVYRIKVFSKSDRFVFLFLLSNLVIEIIATILQYMIIRNSFLSYPKTLLNILFFLLFLLQLKFSEFERKLLYVMAIFISLLLPLETIYISEFNQINTVSLTLSSMFIAIYSIRCLKNIFENQKNSLILSNRSFWYSIAFFIYGFFSIIPNCFERSFVETSLNLYYFFDTLKVIAYGLSFLFFAFAFSLIKKK
jgi:hypothetical protein